MRVHAAEGSKSGVIDPLATAHVEFCQILQPRREGGQTVRVHLVGLLVCAWVRAFCYCGRDCGTRLTN